MKDIFIRYGHEKFYFNVPESWNILTLASFDDYPVSNSIEKLIRRAINNPVEAAPLEKQLKPAAKVAILIEDNTRNSPKKEILRILLAHLEKLSIPPENISVIAALGTHQFLSKEELEHTYGHDIVKEYCFYNHDCMACDLVQVGKLRSGTAVKINRLAYEADFRIGIGSIFPHPLNGFGGGGKILFPGIANFDAILEHHLIYAFRNSVLGRLEDNPFYDEISSLAAAGRLDFIINSVLDHNDNLYSVVAGNPVAAHRAGAIICKRILTKNFRRRSDVTIISAFPYTQATQLMKPLEPASIITREQGVIIISGNCTSRFPPEYLEACSEFRKQYKGKLRESLFECFNNNRCIIKNGSPELNMSLAQVILAIDNYRVILFSSDIPREDAEKLGCIHADTIEEAFLISEEYIKNPSVNIVPSGGVIIPELP
ncbi:MAG: nickel-dependent lactate racemase [Deltaproteobacteria bacterium]|nr:nickel-dependent lactate racemase [Deltaproteobacteria bacterium]